MVISPGEQLDSKVSLCACAAGRTTPFRPWTVEVLNHYRLLLCTAVCYPLREMPFQRDQKRHSAGHARGRVGTLKSRVIFFLGYWETRPGEALSEDWRQPG